MEPMARTTELLGRHGATADHMFVNTPVCCPSRAQIVSGRYGHNNLVQASLGKGCMFANITSRDFIDNSIGARMASLGYRTGLLGKYMNNPACDCPADSGCVKRTVNSSRTVPPGWDRWFAACTMGIFFNNTFNSDGDEITYGDSPEVYMTTVIGNETLNFIRDSVINHA